MNLMVSSFSALTADNMDTQAVNFNWLNVSVVYVNNVTNENALFD